MPRKKQFKKRLLFLSPALALFVVASTIIATSQVALVVGALKVGLAVAKQVYELHKMAKDDGTQKDLAGTYRGIMYLIHDPLDQGFKLENKEGAFSEESLKKLLDLAPKELGSVSTMERFQRTSAIALKLEFRSSLKESAIRKYFTKNRKPSHYRLAYNDKNDNLNYMYGAVKVTKIPDKTKKTKWYESKDKYANALITFYKPKNEWNQDAILASKNDEDQLFFSMVVPYYKIKKDGVVFSNDPKEKTKVKFSEELDLGEVPNVMIHTEKFSIGQFKNVAPYKVDLAKKDKSLPKQVLEYIKKQFKGLEK